MSKPNPPPTEEQKSRVRKLLSSVQVDKVTVSFSIEDRDITGRKRSAFVSLTASRGAGAEVPQMQEENSSTGFTVEEARVVRAYLSREVVRGTYDDAFRRRVLAYSEENRDERDRIIKSYDATLDSVAGVDKGTQEVPGGDTPSEAIGNGPETSRGNLPSD